MRRVLAILATVVAMLTGCTGHGDCPHGTAKIFARFTGCLCGVAVGSCAVDISRAGMRVRIVDAGKRVTNVTTTQGGVGTVSLAPGRYAVDMGTDEGCQQTRFSIAAGRTTVVHYWCQQP